MKGFTINKILMTVLVTAIGVAIIWRVSALKKLVTGEG